MEFSRWKNFFVVFITLEILAVGFSFVLNDTNYFADKVAAVSKKIPVVTNAVPGAINMPQKLANPPKIIKAVFVTGYSAGSKKYLNYLTELFKTTEINAVVVDIKGSDGYVTYNSGAPDVAKYNLYRGAIKDINGLIEFFHSQNIYVIGRIANFEDPVYSKVRPELAIYSKAETLTQNKLVLWQDRNKLSWLDPASRSVWDYNISLAKDGLANGFDEINFDYVRFPTDGKAGDMGFPTWNGTKVKADVINEFFHYVRNALPGEKLSVDLFGQVTTNTDDMGIGQLLENAFENFDYISPMVYPSHYIDGFDGFPKPAEHPYDVIKYALDTAILREANYKTKNPTIVKLAQFRPWLQDFKMGAVYTASMIKDEIRATQDSLGSNYNGFMLWNAGNRYTAEAVQNSQ